MSAPKNELLEIFSGIVLAVAVNISAVMLLLTLWFVLNIVGLPPNLIDQVNKGIIFAFLGMGIWQVVYILPVIAFFQRKGEYGKVKGLIIGAVLITLLTAGCWSLLKPS